MTANQGVRRFGARGQDAIAKELEPLLTREVLHGVHANKLTAEQRKAALRYLMFLKEKQCGTIKGRGCADGRKQRLSKTKEETSSPNVKNEALFLSCLIDAIENRHTLVCDIPGAFMQADIDELVHVKLEGAILTVCFVLLLLSNSLSLTKMGSPYCTRSSIRLSMGLYRQRLSTFLVQTLGFTINPYDSCVTNKDIEGSQCTIAWYVDDLKISHKQESVVESIFEDLQAEFGQQAPLTVTRGKKHNYLGMDIDFSEQGKVKFTMPHMINEIVQQLPKK